MGLRKFLLANSVFSHKSTPAKKSLPPSPVPTDTPYAPPTQAFGWLYTLPAQDAPTGHETASTPFTYYGWPLVAESPTSSPFPSPTGMWNNVKGGGDGDSYFTSKNCQPDYNGTDDRWTSGYPSYPQPPQPRLSPLSPLSEEGDSYFTYKPHQPSYQEPAAQDPVWTPGFPYHHAPRPACSRESSFSSVSSASSSSTAPLGSTTSLSTVASKSSTLCATPTSTPDSKAKANVPPLRPALKRRGDSSEMNGLIKSKCRVSFRNPTARSPVLMHPLFACSSAQSPPASPSLGLPESPTASSTTTLNPSKNEASSPTLSTSSPTPRLPSPSSAENAQSLPGSALTHRAPILYDASLPPSVEAITDWCGDRIPAQSLLEPATEPSMTGRFILEYGEVPGGLHMPWKLEVWAGGNVRDSGGTSPSIARQGGPGLGAGVKKAKFYIEDDDEEDEEDDDGDSDCTDFHFNPNVVVSNLDVLSALHSSLNMPIRQHEWDSLDAESQKKVYYAYKMRCKGNKDAMGQGVKRVDWLEGRTMFVGVESFKADELAVEEGGVVGRIVLQDKEEA